MPAVGQGATHGTIIGWRARAGEVVLAGAALAEIEGLDGQGSLVVMDVEAPCNGVLVGFLAPESAKCAVGAPIARIMPHHFAAKVQAAGSPISHAAAPSHSNAPQQGAMQERPHARMSYRKALTLALREEMLRNPNIVLMGEEIGLYEGAFKVTEGLLAEFGKERVVDTPIVEAGFAGVAIGAAQAGLRPVVEFMHMGFAMQAFDLIINAAAQIRFMSAGQITCPVVFRGPNGAGSRVGAQHGHDMAPLFAHFPGLIVVAPATARDAKGLLKSALQADEPVMFLEHERLYGVSAEVPLAHDFCLPLGEAACVQEGRDATVVTYSAMVAEALEAAHGLLPQGIAVEVIDVRTLRPLDFATIKASVEKTGLCLVVEEALPHGGLGAEIAARVMEECFDALDGPVKRLCARDAPLPYAANLEALALPNATTIMQALIAMVRG